VTADTPDPRPVSPPSELTTEEVRATNALFEAMREAGLFGRRRQAVEDAAHHLAAVARAVARAAPQADYQRGWNDAMEARLTTPQLLKGAADRLAAPQADAGTLREALTEAIRLASGAGNGTLTRTRPIEEWRRLDRLFRAALAASSPATAGTVWPRWECSSCRKNADQCSRETCCPECDHDPIDVEARHHGVSSPATAGREG